ncbi:MAG: phage portal protein, partial [Pacificimonas sp.]
MFNWLSRKGERTASARYPLAFLRDLTTSDGDVPRGYEARARAALCENPVAARAVRLVAEAAGAADLLIETGAPEDADALSALLAAPNPRLSGAAFLERIAAHLVLHGNAYVQAA